ncbi:MAG: DivIVA domain-containing protein [Actinomycetes bacterium]
MKHVLFPRARRWRRGYHCRQVEAFLSKVEISLNGHMPPMAASDIRRAGFELVRHGYSLGAVDAHLDALEERVLTVQSALSGRRGRTDPERDAQFLRDELDAPYMRRFPRSRMLRRGYHLDDVDDFIDEVTAALSGDGEVTVEQAREVSFRPKRGGYSEDAVDETLDRIVEVLLVKRRAAQGTPGSPRSDVETTGPAL